MSHQLANKLIHDSISAIATCWSIKRKDGVTLRFTDCDQDICIKGQTYLASGGLTSSNISTSGGTSVDNFDITGVISSELISDDDIIQGKYDHAEIRIAYVNYLNPKFPVLKFKKGWIGEIKFNKQQFTAEVRGLTQALHSKFSATFSPLCRAQFGDRQCQVNKADFTFDNIRIDHFIDRFAFNSKHFLDICAKSSSNLVEMFKFARITLLGSTNKPLFSSEIHSISQEKIALAQEIPSNSLSANSFQIIAGCNKKFETCCNLYKNALNFRGEPDVPVEINDYL